MSPYIKNLGCPEIHVAHEKTQGISPPHGESPKSKSGTEAILLTPAKKRQRVLVPPDPNLHKVHPVSANAVQP